MCLWAPYHFYLLPGGRFNIKAAQRYCYMYLWQGTRTLPQGCTLLLLTLPPLSPCSIPSLFNNCLNLPLGTQGRSWRAEWSLVPVFKTWGTQKGFVPKYPHRVLLDMWTEVPLLKKSPSVDAIFNENNGISFWQSNNLPLLQFKYKPKWSHLIKRDLCKTEHLGGQSSWRFIPYPESVELSY